MPPSPHQQREIKEREARMLAAGRQMLLESGYINLSMGALATRLEYSRPTMYQHFRNKEELILALGIETGAKRAELFNKAASFKGSSRERMTAIGVAAELFVRLFPDHFRVEQVLRSTGITEKTSPERQAVMRSCETRCLSVVGGVVRDAIAQGDLELSDGVVVEDVVFGLWSMNFGGYLIIDTSAPLLEIGIQDPTRSLQLNCQRLLDGYGWTPRSTEFDVEKVVQDVIEQVFPEESKHAFA